MIITDLMKTTALNEEKKNPNNTEAIKMIVKSLWEDNLINDNMYVAVMDVVEGVTE